MARRVLPLLLLLAFAAAARAQPALSMLDDGMPGPRTQVLVLATAHLAQGQAPLDRALGQLQGVDVVDAARLLADD